MKPEPLKDKEITGQIKGKNVDRLYDERDVKSAVEWLKEELKKRDDRLQYNKKWVYKLIDEAFEDVTKPENQAKKLTRKEFNDVVKEGYDRFGKD